MLPTKFYEPEEFLRYLEGLPDATVVGWAGHACECPVANYAHSLGVTEAYLSATNIHIIPANGEPASKEPLNEWQRRVIAVIDDYIDPDEARKRGRHGYTGITKREAIETMRQIMGSLAQGG